MARLQVDCFGNYGRESETRLNGLVVSAILTYCLALVRAVANPEHLAKLHEGVDAWNQWRQSHPSIMPNLSGANFSGANLHGANLSKADLSKADLSKAELLRANLFRANLFSANLRGVDLRGADLSEADLCKANLGEANLFKANLSEANLSEADLTQANLSEADLSKAYLSKAYLFRANLHGANLSKRDLGGADFTEADLGGADLTEANLSKAYLGYANLHGTNLSAANLSGAELLQASLTSANLSRGNLSGATLTGATLSGANLSGADLSGADLRGATLVNSNLEGTDLSGCSVYGVSVWNAKLEGAIQSNLLITDSGEPAIRVDNLDVAQFVYLLLDNKKIRDVIDTIGKKAVLILGRFTPERKAILDSIRDALRHYGFLPIVFDFEKPSTRDTQETIVTLAGLARFIIADISDPKSIPQELASVVPTLPSVPVQPLLQDGYEPWGMYDHIKRFPWVLPLVKYENQQSLLRDLEPKVLGPAEAKAKEQTAK
jgi:uncharacterized protein YjbI with pentapeptide repeats